MAQWTEYINKGMKACNARTTSNAQRVGKWALIPTDFSVDGESSRTRQQEAFSPREHVNGPGYSE